MIDPRLFQIAALSGLIVWGTLGLGFDIRPAQAGVVIASALLTQWLGARATGQDFDPRSPLISSLSLCLLLRADALSIAAAVACLTISSKFLIRYRGKHVFNPTTFGLAVGLLASDGVWISAGQWGTSAWSAFAMACIGMLVLRRAERSDVTWAFLASYLALVFGRSIWLGDPMVVPAHSVQNGALLLFAFFMISDPRTTPDSRAGRIFFAAWVACVAVWVQFGLYRPNALIWALATSAPLVPLLDRLLPGPAHQWTRPRRDPAPHSDSADSADTPGSPNTPDTKGSRHVEDDWHHGHRPVWASR